MTMNILLYVKVSGVNKNSMTYMQEELMHRKSEVMIRRYEKQISEYMSSVQLWKFISPATQELVSPVLAENPKRK